MVKSMVQIGTILFFYFLCEKVISNCKFKNQKSGKASPSDALSNTTYL